MATPMQKAIAEIKAEGVLKELMFKTIGTQVILNSGETVESQIASILSEISSLPTDSNVDSRIKASCDELYNKILGKVNDDTAIDEAYDTLKEVADWITAHGEIAAGFISDIAGLKTAAETLNTELDAVKGRLGTAEGKITALETDTGALKTDVAALKAVGATKTEKSGTNGNIKVNGTETVVYTHPENHPASMITQDADHRFITDNERTDWTNRPVVYSGTSEPEMKNGDVFIRLVD